MAGGPVLIAGGPRDPNLGCLAAAVTAAGAAVILVEVGAGRRPWLTWDLDEDTLVVDGEALAPAAAFVRHDVFEALVDPRPEVTYRAGAWSSALFGWLLAHPEVRLTNRRGLQAWPSKPFALMRARALGLAVPRTRVTNHAGQARALGDAIAKPVAGGDLTRTLDEALGRTGDGDGGGAGDVLAAPALVQERLVAPERRIYVVGDDTFAFEVASPHLDYRAADDARVSYLGEAAAELAGPLRALADEMGLDFAAADFKSRPDGQACFLEINTGPMFARFDQASDGRLAAALAAWLLS